jgi:hypothetical protein
VLAAKAKPQRFATDEEAKAFLEAPNGYDFSEVRPVAPLEKPSASKVLDELLKGTDPNR